MLASLLALNADNRSAQGTINFANRVAGVVDAPMLDVGCVDKVSGPDAYAQLWAGPSADTMAAGGSPVAFRSGAGAGYWPSTALTIPTVAPGAVATVQVRWWKGAAGSTYESAAIRLSGSIFSVKTGGDGSPPSPPGSLVGLTSFCIPEATPLAFGLLGVGVTLL